MRKNELKLWWFFLPYRVRAARIRWEWYLRNFSKPVIILATICWVAIAIGLGWVIVRVIGPGIVTFWGG